MKRMLYHERKARKKGYRLIAGIDEAGRGPLAGPVVAACVVLGTDRFTARIADSKALTPRARERAYGEIIERCRYGIGIVTERIIDEINVYQATIQAMRTAVGGGCPTGRIAYW